MKRGSLAAGAGPLVGTSMHFVACFVVVFAVLAVPWEVCGGFKGSLVPGGTTLAAIIEALNYAVAMGAPVSNHSYGGYGASQAQEDSIIAAGAAGHIVVASAGNDFNNNDFFPAYPASYPQDNVIAVAATDQFDNLAGFSNFGRTTVDIGAPGVNIWSTTPDERLVDISSRLLLQRRYVDGSPNGGWLGGTDAQRRSWPAL